MNSTHLHLLLNHAPVLGTPFGLGILGLGLWRNSAELKITALGIFVIVALLAVPVYLTGEPAAGGVNGLLGVSQSIMEEHEEAATVAFVSVLALGAAGLAGLIVFRGSKRVPAWLGSSMLVAALVVSGLMAWTANLGGQIRHTEIRAGTSPADTIKNQGQD